MKNLSNTKKILLGVGVVVASYYAWTVWRTYNIAELKRKALANTDSEPTIDSSLSAPQAFTEA